MMTLLVVMVLLLLLLLLAWRGLGVREMVTVESKGTAGRESTVFRDGWRERVTTGAREDCESLSGGQRRGVFCWDGFLSASFFSPRLENLHRFIDCFSAGAEGFLVFVVNLV
jgi:hypothetical protein